MLKCFDILSLSIGLEVFYLVDFIEVENMTTTNCIAAIVSAFNDSNETRMASMGKNRWVYTNRPNNSFHSQSINNDEWAQFKHAGHLNDIFSLLSFFIVRRFISRHSPCVSEIKSRTVGGFHGPWRLPYNPLFVMFFSFFPQTTAKVPAKWKLIYFNVSGEWGKSKVKKNNLKATGKRERRGKHSIYCIIIMMRNSREKFLCENKIRCQGA